MIICSSACARDSSVTITAVADGRYWLGMAEDASRLLRVPFGWDAADWGKFALVAGGALAVGIQDDEIRELAQESRSKTTNDAARIAEAFGNGIYVVPALAATAVCGRLSNAKGLERASLQAIENVILASGMLNGAAKIMTQRHRPFMGNGPGAWNGPGLSFRSSRGSFLSGHACTAFAAATAFAGEYDESRWVGPLAYSAAGAVALSRINDDAHWGSDVIFGAALGYFAGGALDRWRKDRDGRQSSGAELTWLSGGPAVLLRFKTVLL